MVMERSELDNAMSWLSALGGAYSALGDHFSHCVSTTDLALNLPTVSLYLYGFG